jgi:beta-N-acetylhexosaminidase
LNYNIVTSLLRQELGYKHLVVTDDLEMGAIARHCEIEDAAVRAALAGEDMLLICATPEKIRRGYHGLLEAAKSGKLTEERIKETLDRIARTKTIMEPPLPLDMTRFQQLADEILKLNSKLNYTYGGTIK